MYSVQVGAQFIASGAHKRVLAIGSDVMSSIIDYTDRATCVIFGDGAGAAILEPAENDSEGLIDFIHEVDGSGGQFLYMPGGGSLHPTSKETIAKKMHYVHQDGQQVFKFAVRKQTELCLRLLERNGLNGSDIDVFIPHQANLRIINATAERLGLRPESVIVNIDRYGNTTAGTIPLAMLSDSMRILVAGSVTVDMRAPEASGDMKATGDYIAGVVPPSAPLARAVSPRLPEVLHMKLLQFFSLQRRRATPAGYTLLVS